MNARLEPPTSNAAMRLYSRTSASCWLRFAREASWDLRAGRRTGLPMFLARLKQSVVDVHGVRVRIDRSFSYDVAKALFLKHYEAPERTLIEKSLQSSDVVMELGGGLGYMSTLCAKITGASRVFVYEANPAMERIIRDTHLLNGVHPTVRIAMVGRDRGTAAFHVAADFIVSSTRPVAGTTSTVAVEVLSLRDELERIRPTVLVVDIEGGEYELFRDFPPNACRLIMLELHPKVLGEPCAGEVLQWIGAMGFRLRASIMDSYLFERAAV